MGIIFQNHFPGAALAIRPITFGSKPAISGASSTAPTLPGSTTSHHADAHIEGMVHLRPIPHFRHPAETYRSGQASRTGIDHGIAASGRTRSTLS